MNRRDALQLALMGGLASCSMFRPGVSGVVNPVSATVDYIVSNQAALFGHAVKASAGAGEWPLLLTLGNAENANSQDQKKWRDYQFKDILNVFGLSFEMKSNPKQCGEGIEKTFTDYVKRYGQKTLVNYARSRTGYLSYEIDPTIDSNGFFSDILLVGTTKKGGNLLPMDIPGITGVRKGHILWMPNTSLQIHSGLAELINAQYLHMAVEGKSQPISERMKNLFKSVEEKAPEIYEKVKHPFKG